MPGLYQTYSDAELLILFSGSDKKAFTEIYDRYWDKLFFIAGKKTRDLGEADNLVHDVLLDLWKRRATIKLSSELNNYLAAAMKYRVMKWQVKQKRAGEYARSIDTGQLHDKQTPEDLLRFEELKERLSLLVKKLPDQCRIAYELREEGLSQKEIANHMHIAEHTVERHLSRAFKSLRTGISRLFSFFL
jgi:RNA polymerase sigma-70 factor (ECF subfamily)